MILHFVEQIGNENKNFVLPQANVSHFEQSKAWVIANGSPRAQFEVNLVASHPYLKFVAFNQHDVAFLLLIRLPMPPGS